MGRTAVAAHRAGHPRGRARAGAPGRAGAADLRRPHRHRRPRPGPGGPPRRRRGRAGRERRPQQPAAGDGTGTPAQRDPPRGRPGAPGAGGAGGLRRAVLRGVAALRLPDRRRPAPGGPAGARARAGLAARARRRRDERRGRPADRRARLRRLLQEAGGRHHDPHPARPVLGPRHAGAGRGDGARGRVLPQHGALAGRLHDRGRRGAPRARLGRTTCWPGASATGE